MAALKSAGLPGAVLCAGDLEPPLLNRLWRKGLIYLEVRDTSCTCTDQAATCLFPVFPPTSQYKSAACLAQYARCRIMHTTEQGLAIAFSAPGQ